MTNSMMAYREREQEPWFPRCVTCGEFMRSERASTEDGIFCNVFVCDACVKRQCGAPL